MLLSSTAPSQALLLVLSPLLLPFLLPAVYAADDPQTLSTPPAAVPSSSLRPHYTPVPRSRRDGISLEKRAGPPRPEHVERAAVQKRRDQALRSLERGLARGLEEDHAAGSTSQWRKRGENRESMRGKMDLKLGRRGTGSADGGERQKRDGVAGGTNQTAVMTNLGSGSGIYTLPVQIGTPPLTYTLQVDTASSDLLLASSGCSSSSCPDGPPTSDLYRPGRSTSFLEVNGNGTEWNATFGDGGYAAGFVGRESVGMVNAYIRGTEPVSASTTTTSSSASVQTAGGSVLPEINGVDGFVLDHLLLGLINQTTIDLKAEGTQGILGLGFPRGTVLGRAVAKSEGLTASGNERTTGTTSPVSATEDVTFTILAGSTISSASPTTTGSTTVSVTTTSKATPTASPSTPYYPTFLETLFASPALYYPVFALALSNSSGPFSSETDEATITFGGVSAEFVLPSNANTTESGRRVEDIEWWDVVPFARVIETAATNAISANATSGSTTIGTTSTSTAIGATSTGSNWLNDLEEQAYLYWALELSAITVNGTDVPLEPTYNSTVTGRTSSVALLDIGSNGIYGPQQDVINIFDQIPDSRVVSDGQWAVPCDTQQTMTFSFGSNGRVLELQPSEWIIGAVAGSSLCLAWPVVASPSADGVDWQLGTPVLRKAYTIFGYGIDGLQSPVIGFLPLPDPVIVLNGTSTSAIALGPSGSSSSTQTSTIPIEGTPVAGSTRTSISISSTSTTPRNPTDPTPISVQNASQIASALTVTYDTVLPNVVLPNPTFTTPPYAFETSSIPAAGNLQTDGLANMTAYPAISAVQIVRPSAATVPTTATSTMRGFATTPAGSSSATDNASESARQMGMGGLWTMCASLAAWLLLQA